MFLKACEIARQFTWPVVISRLTVDGTCEAGIGTFIPVNADGWIVTANHILQLMAQLAVEEQQTRELKANITRINDDKTLGNKERRRKLAELGHLKSDALEKWSVWWGQDGARIVPGSDLGIPAADVAVARLAIDFSGVKEFPRFKKVAGEFEAGRSLCRMGFPFWDVKPAFDAAANRFIFKRNMGPHATIGVPLFANEGILARQFETFITDEQGNVVGQPAFRLRAIETSNAGLLGQSGGPIFDQNGIVWGVQTSTVSYQLDLNTKDNQYYNVGVGCHSETVIGLLTQLGIKHEVADE